LGYSHKGNLYFSFLGIPEFTKFVFFYLNLKLLFSYTLKPAMYHKLVALLLVSFTVCAQNTQKPLIESKNGMVVSTHPIASEIGLQILQKGGNAIDAAVAVNFALAVCHPAAGNIGGGGFLVYRTAKGKAFTLDYREKAPAKASRDMYLDSTGTVIPGKSLVGIFSAGVPGTVNGMVAAHRKFGRLAWADVVQPAIDIAMNGVVLTEKEARGLNRNRIDFVRENPGKSYLIAPDGQEFVKGQLVKQVDLGQTLTRIAQKKNKGFYQGETADMLVEEMRKQNGLITHQDLRKYRAVWRKPLISTYKNFRVIGMPPPSSGGIALAQLMKMVEPFPLKKWGPNADSTLQVMIEAERRVYADRALWLGDPDFVKVPVAELVNSTYVANRMNSVNFDKATKSSDIKAGVFAGYESPETTHYSIVDAEGNAVSITTTLNNSFGSKVFVGGAGFLLNDEMDDFSSKAGVPNSFGLVGSKANEIQPGKRMLSSMTPTIIESNGKLKMVVGTPGGSTIITSVFQVVLNTLEMGMNMQQAVEFPRFHHQWLPDNTRVEANRFTADQMARLKAKGYEFETSGGIGLVEGILILPDGRLQGGADSRGDDTVKAY
jgi:gamma-glutamyltranspeptidase/glutathione hydrolase